MNCPPVDIANSMVTVLEAARDAGSTFSTSFVCKASLGDFHPKLEGEGLSETLVDIVLPVTPSIEVTGRPRNHHTMIMTVGVRKRLSSGHVNPDGSFDVDEIAPLMNLFYELIGFILPSDDNPSGKRFYTDDWVAISDGTVNIEFLWHPGLLVQAKQYCGLFRANLVVSEVRD